MKIFQAVHCYGEHTIVITENLNDVLEAIKKGFDCNVQIIIWENGETIFHSKMYDKEEYNYDSMYIEMMSFVERD